MIGNAVPVVMAKILASKIMADLSALDVVDKKAPTNWSDISKMMALSATTV